MSKAVIYDNYLDSPLLDITNEMWRLQAVFERLQDDNIANKDAMALQKDAMRRYRVFLSKDPELIPEQYKKAYAVKLASLGTHIQQINEQLDEIYAAKYLLYANKGYLFTIRTLQRTEISIADARVSFKKAEEIRTEMKTDQHILCFLADNLGIATQIDGLIAQINELARDFYNEGAFQPLDSISDSASSMGTGFSDSMLEAFSEMASKLSFS